MTPGIIVFTVGIAFTCGALIGFIAGFFFNQGSE